MDTFPEHNLFLEMLQRKYQEDEQRVQHIKSLDEQTLRKEVAHSTVSVQLLEDQLCLSSARIEVIRNQAAKFKINIHFLEPSKFESIASEASAWKKFLNSQAGPSSWAFYFIVIYCKFYKHLMKEKCGRWRVGEAQESFRGQPNSFVLLYKYRESRQEEGLFPS